MSTFVSALRLSNLAVDRNAPVRRSLASRIAARSVLAFGSVLALCSPPAQAQPAVSGWYLHANFGTSSVSDPSVTLNGAGAGKLRLGSGNTNGGSIGVVLGRDWRVEAEVSYRSNKLKGSTAPGVDPVQTDADYAALFLFANVTYDLAEWRTSWATFRPYIGIGLGRAQEIDVDMAIGGAAREFSGSASATQWLAGLRWDYNSRWSAGLGLRGVRVGSLGLGGTGPVAGQRLQARYSGTTAVLSLGYRF